MCHSTDSRPPAPPVQGEVASHEQIELTAADGNRFLAYRAEPAEPNGRCVVILPDVRGLHPFYRDLAVRFAEAGFPTIAIDYFGRTADGGERDDDFDFMTHVNQLTPEGIRADVRAATEELSDRGPVFTVGFCMGGSQSWRQAAEGNGLAGGIGFYGALRFIDPPQDGPGAPLLLLRGGADTVSTPEEFEAYEATLDRVGTEHETHVYEGAPHSFFDRSYGEWAEACQDAWKRILSFTERHAQPR
ncbi:dienelactone hydrolase family protein [Nonomuraea sp. KC401]|uniref:dienelactone hydrolase family protein n=1 Tax=unclassified Nonomuraea TaxID=2593643 RepID=UPI0010FF225B|nr:MULTISPECIES: dienelactone hydrolase family protein [unclassified Nonomuraea]NBE97398.1 dienelactone hydrolase family protein [Nonomuraea sp. K271]TLF64852.1 dienelactone hydrolase family protein [Nonomuraea sp. KC401]